MSVRGLAAAASVALALTSPLAAQGSKAPPAPPGSAPPKMVDEKTMLARINDKLRGMPVFTLGSPDGKLLSQSTPEGPSMVAFIAPVDAEAVRADITKGGAAPKDVRVLPISLADVVLTAQGKGPDGKKMRVALTPSEPEVKLARAVLVAQGQKPEVLNTPPVYLVKSSPGGNYVSVQDPQGKSTLPVFTAKADVDQMMAKLKADNPTLGAKAVLEVSTLDRFIEIVLTQDDGAVAPLVLVPPSASIQFVQKIAASLAPPAGGAAAPMPGKPGAAPKR
ncbi:MAG: Tic22 family protein [Gemmatimonadales bacterium]|nr:Tic22 family protein [Gemmatimonadales bacterium]